MPKYRFCSTFDHLVFCLLVSATMLAMSLLLGEKVLLQFGNFLQPKWKFVLESPARHIAKWAWNRKLSLIHFFNDSSFSRTFPFCIASIGSTSGDHQKKFFFSVFERLKSEVASAIFQKPRIYPLEGVLCCFSDPIKTRLRIGGRLMQGISHPPDP